MVKLDLQAGHVRMLAEGKVGLFQLGGLGHDFGIVNHHELATEVREGNV